VTTTPPLPNSIDNPAKPTDLDPNIILGSVDDTVAVERIMNLANNQAKKLTDPTKYFWLDFGPNVLYCEATVNWPGTKTTPSKHLAVIAKTEARTLGYDTLGNLIPADQYDVLGNARNRVVRNRALWQRDWAEHCKLTRGTITGPHKATQRNRSINSVLEQQCGIWERSTIGNEICAMTIKDTWGDSIGMATAEVYGRLVEQVHIWGNTIDRNGRECFLITGMNSGNIHDNVILKHTAQIFHSESGSGTVRPQLWMLHNNLVVDVPGEQGGYFLHCTGGSTPQEIWVQANVVKGQALQVYVGTTKTTEKIGELWVIDNTWNRAQIGGYLLNAGSCREVHYKRNTGFARRVNTMAQQVKATNCDLVDISTAGIVQV